MTAPSLSSLIGRVRELDKAATPGPWRARRNINTSGDGQQITDEHFDIGAGAETWHENKGCFHPSQARFVIDETKPVRCGMDRDYNTYEAGIALKSDAEFIAESRTLLVQLADAAERMQERVAELEGQIAEAEGMARQVMMFCNQPGCESPRVGQNCPRCKVDAGFLFLAAPSRPDTEK